MKKNYSGMSGELCALVAFFGFTASNLFDKLGLSGGADPFAALIYKDCLIFLLSVFMSFKLGLYKKCFSKSSPDYCGFKGAWPYILSGPIMDGIGTALFYVAINAGSLVVAVPCIQSQTMWAAIISAIMLKEKLNKQTIIGIVVFIVGLLLVNCGGYLDSGFAGAANGNPILCAVIALIAGFAWAFSTVLWKKGMVNGCDKWAGLSIHYPCAWLFAFLYLAFTNNLGAYKISGEAVAALAGSGIASGLIGVTFFMMALNKTTVNKANVIKSAYPILLSVLAWLIFGEYLNVWMFIGIVITVVGVVLVNKADSDKATAKSAA